MVKPQEEGMGKMMLEKIVCLSDQPQTNLGVVQYARTNTNLGMVGFASTVAGVEDATAQVATANRNNPLGHDIPECQSFFVRMGSNDINVVSRSVERVKEHKMMSTGDIEILDSTLELVEVKKIVGLVRNNGSTTEPSSGEKVCPVVTAKADSETQEPILERYSVYQGVPGWPV